MSISIVENIDNMVFMRKYPDKYFDLAICDPPYGININNNMGRRKGDKNSNHKKIDWDSKSPDKEYFKELFRVSKNQIIWGGNYFLDKIPYPTSCFLLWDKKFSEELSFAQYEIAWTSFNTPSKKYEKSTNEKLGKIHPTQKPIDLYKWILKNYAKQGDKILDTHGGSMSSVIASLDMGFEIHCCELDKDYFESAKKRIEQYLQQPKIFDTHGGVKFTF